MKHSCTPAISAALPAKHLKFSEEHADPTFSLSEIEPEIIARIHSELEVDINSSHSNLTKLGKAALIGRLREKNEHIRRTHLLGML